MKKKIIALTVALVAMALVALAVITSVKLLSVNDSDTEVTPVKTADPEPGTGEYVMLLFEKEFSLIPGSISGDSVFTQREKENPVTREMLVYMAVSAIHQCPELKARFVPAEVQVQQGENSELFESLYGSFKLKENEIYSGLVLEKQQKQCSRIDVKKVTYEDGSLRYYLCFRKNDCLLTLPSDFESVQEKYREYTGKAFEYGIGPFEYAEDSFDILFLPGERADEQDIQGVLEILKGNILPEHADSVSINADGFMDNCMFSTDFLPLIHALKVFEHDLGTGDRGVLAPDLDMTGFGIWFGTESLGTLCLPLNYCGSDPLMIVFTPLDTASPENKLKSVSMLFPESEREKFIGRAKAYFAGTGDSDFYAGNISCSFFRNDTEGCIMRIGTVYEEG